MSSIGSTSSVLNAVGASRTAIQIAVPTGNSPEPTAPTNFDLEAAVQRVATLLYMRAHLEVPPDVTDMGGGLFNVVV